MKQPQKANARITTFRSSLIYANLLPDETFPTHKIHLNLWTVIKQPFLSAEMFECEQIPKNKFFLTKHGSFIFHHRLNIK